MRVIGLDGKNHSFVLAHNQYAAAENKSSFHLAARKLIAKLYPWDTPYEEVTLPGTATKQHGVLFADFVIPRRRLIIEVHGEQHYKFNPYFHVDMSGWRLQQLRDADKLKWCKLNNWNYVELKYDQQHEWQRQLESA